MEKIFITYLSLVNFDSLFNIVETYFAWYSNYIIIVKLFY